MKRANVLLIIILLALSIFPQTVVADVPEDPFVQQIINSSQRVNDFTESDNKTNYLQREWSKVLETNAAGRTLLLIGDFFKGFNPIIEKMVGWPYEISWAFFFALVIWFTIAGFVWRPIGAMVNNNGIAIVLSFVMASFFGFSGIIKQIVTLTAFLIRNRWIAIIGMVIALLLSVFFERLGKKIAQKIKKNKENIDKEIIHNEAKMAEESIKYREKGANQVRFTGDNGFTKK